jgi:hypothetical protein
LCRFTNGKSNGRPPASAGRADREERRQPQWQSSSSSIGCGPPPRS